MKDSGEISSAAHVSMTFEELELGQAARLTRVVSRADIHTFADLCGDFNPVHLDENYAATSLFKAPIAHGMLTGSLISAVFGMKLPGAGAIYISQTLNFRGPVYIGDEITAEVEIADLYQAKNRVKFQCLCRNQDGKTVLSGEAILMVPSAASTS